MKPGRVHNFGTYFVTAQTWERRALFRSEKMAKLFLEVLHPYRSEKKYLLHEFVLMPDHSCPDDSRGHHAGEKHAVY